MFAPRRFAHRLQLECVVAERDFDALESAGSAVNVESPGAPEGGMDADTLDLAFSGDLWYWRGPAPFYFITVPDDASVAVHALSAVLSYGWGMIPVRVEIGESVWETSLFPRDGRYVVPVKDVVRKAEGLAQGDTVTVRLVIPH